MPDGLAFMCLMDKMGLLFLCTVSSNLILRERIWFFMLENNPKWVLGYIFPSVLWFVLVNSCWLSNTFLPSPLQDPVRACHTPFICILVLTVGWLQGSGNAWAESKAPKVLPPAAIEVIVINWINTHTKNQKTNRKKKSSWYVSWKTGGHQESPSRWTAKPQLCPTDSLIEWCFYRRSSPQGRLKQLPSVASVRTVHFL